MLWRFFVAELYLHIYIQILMIFFARVAVAKIFRKVIGLKFFCSNFGSKTISELIERIYSISRFVFTFEFNETINDD